MDIRLVRPKVLDVHRRLNKAVFLDKNEGHRMSTTNVHHWIARGFFICLHTGHLYPVHAVKYFVDFLKMFLMLRVARFVFYVAWAEYSLILE